jgi:hypothetical protein
MSCYMSALNYAQVELTGSSLILTVNLTVFGVRTNFVVLSSEVLYAKSIQQQCHSDKNRKKQRHVKMGTYIVSKPGK